MEIKCCPQCKQISSDPINRIVRDSCGHFKCRICLLKETDGCIFCYQINNNSYDKTCSNLQKPEVGGLNLAFKRSADVKIAKKSDKLSKVISDVSLKKSAANSGSVSEYASVKNVKRKWPPNVSIESSNPTVYGCNICNKKFRARSHVAYHTFCGGRIKPFSCTLCQKGFTTKSHYLYHIQVHSGKRPYICDVCSASFYQKSKLKRHILIHTGVKDFHCNICDAAFNNAVSLNKHGLIHSGIKPHVCEVCGISFSDSSNLRKHERRHTNLKYSCAECGKQYVNKWSLIVHAVSHRDSRPFSCKHCDKSFNSKKDKQRHELTHSDNKQHKCTICNGKFRRKDNLDRHFRNSHPGIDLCVAAPQKLSHSDPPVSFDKYNSDTSLNNECVEHFNTKCIVNLQDEHKSITITNDIVINTIQTIVTKEKVVESNIAIMKDSIIEANNRRQSVIFSTIRSQPLPAENDVKVCQMTNEQLSDSIGVANMSTDHHESHEKKSQTVDLYKKIQTSSEHNKNDNETSEETNSNVYTNYIHKKVNYEMNKGFSKWAYHKEQFNRTAVCPPDLSKLESYKNPEPVCTPESIELYKKILMPSYKSNDVSQSRTDGKMEASGPSENNSQSNLCDVHWRRRMAHSST